MKEAIDRLSAAIINLKQRVNRLENMRISPRAYGSMYVDSDTIATITSTPVLVNIFDTAGDYRRIAVDIASGYDLTSTEAMENAYLITAFASLTSAGNTTATLTVRKNSVATHITSTITVSTSGTYALHLSGIVRATSSEPISLYVNTGSVLGVNLTFSPVVLNMVKVS